jgi:hypothetical protein
VNDREIEQVSLLDRMRRISPSSREISVIFDGAPNRGAWPDELPGVIVNGLTDAEAQMLIPSGEGRTELYVTDRVTREGQRKRYLLTDLQKESPGRFRFRAMRDFDPSFGALPK